MAKQNRDASTFYTSFDGDSAQTIRTMAKARGQSHGEFIRIAVLDYLKRQEQASAGNEEREMALREQLKKSTERICSLLAKTAIDVNLVARYIWETADDDGQDLYEECHQKAIKRVRQRATPEEKQIVSVRCIVHRVILPHAVSIEGGKHATTNQISNPQRRVQEAVG